jgi:hypothetical protein
MNKYFLRRPGGWPAHGAAGDHGPESDTAAHRLVCVWDDPPAGHGTTDDARFIAECIAGGALLGLVTATARPAAGE